MRIVLWKLEYDFFLLPTLAIVEHNGLNLVLFLFNHAIGIRIYTFK